MTLAIAHGAEEAPGYRLLSEGIKAGCRLAISAVRKNMSEDRHALLAAASAPRRATDDDAARLSRLFAAAFTTDPIFNWIARPGPRRAKVLEQFFFWLLKTRAIPFGEVWMSADGNVCAAWLPPGTTGKFWRVRRADAAVAFVCATVRLSASDARIGDGGRDGEEPPARESLLSRIHRCRSSPAGTWSWRRDAGCDREACRRDGCARLSGKFQSAKYKTV